MIRARTSDGRYILGLDARNVQRLKAGEPIVADLSQMGGRDVVMIVYGETYQAIMDELAEATGAPLPPAQPLPPTEKQ